MSELKLRPPKERTGAARHGGLLYKSGPPKKAAPTTACTYSLSFGSDGHVDARGDFVEAEPLALGAVLDLAGELFHFLGFFDQRNGKHRG